MWNRRKRVLIGPLLFILFKKAWKKNIKYFWNTLLKLDLVLYLSLTYISNFRLLLIPSLKSFIDISILFVTWVMKCCRMHYKIIMLLCILLDSCYFQSGKQKWSNICAKVERSGSVNKQRKYLQLVPSLYHLLLYCAA